VSSGACSIACWPEHLRTACRSTEVSRPLSLGCERASPVRVIGGSRCGSRHGHRCGGRAWALRSRCCALAEAAAGHSTPVSTRESADGRACAWERGARTDCFRATAAETAAAPGPRPATTLLGSCVASSHPTRRRVPCRPPLRPRACPLLPASPHVHPLLRDEGDCFGHAALGCDRTRVRPDQPPVTWGGRGDALEGVDGRFLTASTSRHPVACYAGDQTGTWRAAASQHVRCASNRARRMLSLHPGARGALQQCRCRAGRVPGCQQGGGGGIRARHFAPACQRSRARLDAEGVRP